MAVLKVARQLQLVRELDAVQVPGHAAVPIPEALLQRAIAHANEGLLVDAMTLACVHPKTTAMPGEGGRSLHLRGQGFASPITLLLDLLNALHPSADSYTSEAWEEMSRIRELLSLITGVMMVFHHT